MQKIEFDNNKKDSFYNLINGAENKNNFIKPIVALKKLRGEYHFGQFEYHFITCFIRHYKKIILLDPKSMQLWIKLIDTHFSQKFYTIAENSDGKVVFNQTKFGEKLSSALGYSKLQKQILKKFFHRFQSKTCYYCNAQYTLTFKIGKLESVKFQIDHIFPKKKYPYFSISLFNLVPSCANCNLNKGDRDYWIQDYCHPYIESIGDRFKFSIIKESDKSPYSNSKEVDPNDISISITNLSDRKVNNHDEMFDIVGIHSNFDEIAKEILALGYEYPESKRKELLEKYKGEKGNLMFMDQETIDRIFLRVYPNKENLRDRTLSKFTQDIARFSDFYDDK